MKTWLPIILLALVALALLWPRTPGIAGEAVDAPAIDPVAIQDPHPNETPDLERRLVPPPTQPGVESPLEAMPVPPSLCELVVRVHSTAMDQPLADVGITVTPTCGLDVDLARRSSRTDVSGETRFLRLLPGTWQVRLDRGLERILTLEAGQRETMTFSLEDALAIRCLVRAAEDGSPIAGASIWLGHVGEGRTKYYPEGDYVGTTDAMGTYVVVGPSNTTFAVGASVRGRVPSDLQVVTPDAEEREIVLELQPGGASLSGRVLDEDAHPIENALVRIGPRFGWEPHLQDEVHRGASVLRVRTDAHGAFAADALPPGPVPVLVRADEHAPWSETFVLAPGEDRSIEVRLAGSVQLSGIVTNSQGTPIEGARVTVFGAARYEEARAVTSPTGSYGFSDLAAGTIQIEVRADAVERTRHVLRAAPGNVLTWNPVLRESLTIRGRVVDDDLAARSSWEVCVLTAHGERLGTRTDDEGTFELGPLPEGTCTLFVRPHPDVPFWDASERLGTIPAGARDVLVRVADEVFACTVQGRYVDELGRPIEGAYLGLRRRRVSVTYHGRTDAEGRFHAGDLPAGTHEVELFQRDQDTEHLGTVTLVPGQTHDFGLITYTPRGTLAVTAHLEDRDDHRIMIATERTSAGGESAAQALDEDGACRMELVPGVHRYTIYGTGFATTSGEVTIEAGKETPLEVTLQPGVRRQLVFPDPPPPDWYDLTELDVTLTHRESGRTIRITFENDDLWPFTWWPAMCPGAHELRVRAPGHPELVGTFRLESLAPSSQPIRVPMHAVR
ncbi:MAG: carboxypeptidase regulatory-like domain-containing protein [Planctomycetes bacterium]|nr:carboxypeptidase regulatory-like domain-containing protein [Planctomycetota bacterium]